MALATPLAHAGDGPNLHPLRRRKRVGPGQVADGDGRDLM